MIEGLSKEIINEAVKALQRRHKMPKEQAEDAVQDAILSLLEKPPEERVRNPRALLIKCAFFWYYKRVRAEQKEFLLGDAGWEAIEQPGENNPANQFLGEEGQEVLEALSRGWGEQETADMLGLTRHQLRKIKEAWAYD